MQEYPASTAGDDQGFTVLQILFAIIVAAVYIAQVELPKQSAAVQNIKSGNTAAQLATFDQGLTQYVSSNYSTLVTNTAGGPQTVTFSTISPYITQPGFSGTNPYGQTYSAIVAQPTAGQLVYAGFTVGGTTLPDYQLNLIAGLANTTQGTNDAGSVHSGTPTVITGAANGYSLPVSTFGGGAISTGHLVVSNALIEAQVLTDFLMKDAVPGLPDANTMHTTLHMGGNAIDTVTLVEPTQGVVLPQVAVLGQSCATAGTVAAQSGSSTLGTLIQCIDNGSGPVWSKPSDGPVSFW